MRNRTHHVSARLDARESAQLGALTSSRALSTADVLRAGLHALASQAPDDSRWARLTRALGRPDTIGGGAAIRPMDDAHADGGDLWQAICDALSVPVGTPLEQVYQALAEAEAEHKREADLAPETRLAMRRLGLTFTEYEKRKALALRAIAPRKSKSLARKKPR